MNYTWIFIGAMLGYDLGMGAMLLWDRARHWPNNYRVRKANRAFWEAERVRPRPPLDERIADLRHATLRGANLSGAVLRP